MLGKRDNSEHEAMRKIKNEFMLMWDGLMTKSDERVTVLGATNRPHDLDDAVLRRMPRRILVDLPDAEQRVQILQVILRSESVAPDFDYVRMASQLDGYSGSDIKNLCIAAAYRPIREILAEEVKSGGGAAAAAALAERTDANGGAANRTTSKPPAIRPLTMEDIELAMREVTPSCSEGASSIAELRKWNEMFGEGSRGAAHSNLSYFM